MSISGWRVTRCRQVYHMQKLGHPFLSGLVRIALEKIPALAVASNWRDSRGGGRTTPDSMRAAQIIGEPVMLNSARTLARPRIKKAPWNKATVAADD